MTTTRWKDLPRLEKGVVIAMALFAVVIVCLALIVK